MFDILIISILGVEKKYINIQGEFFSMLSEVISETNRAAE